MNNETIEDMMSGKKSEKKQGIKCFAKAASIVLAGYMAMVGIKALEPKSEPFHMKDLYQLTRVQRNGARVYQEESWEQIDKETQKKEVRVYIDSDNNGAPDTGYEIFYDGTVALYKFSNQRTFKGIIAPVSTEYHEATQIKS